jgi:hypothetical protein
VKKPRLTHFEFFYAFVLGTKFLCFHACNLLVFLCAFALKTLFFMLATLSLNNLNISFQNEKHEAYAIVMQQLSGNFYHRYIFKFQPLKSLCKNQFVFGWCDLLPSTCISQVVVDWCDQFFGFECLWLLLRCTTISKSWLLLVM